MSAPWSAVRSRGRRLRGSAIPEEIVAELVRAFISDLAEGKAPREAGWRNMREGGEARKNLLVTSRIALMRKDGSLRLNFDDPAAMESLNILPNALKGQLDYARFTAKTVQEDVVRLERAVETIRRVGDRLRSSPEDWSSVVALGWWQMLESSGMPAETGNVLEHGFSPRDWTVVATGASAQLAERVAAAYGLRASIGEGLVLLAGFTASEIIIPEQPTPVPEEQVERVAQTLRWNEITREVPTEVQKALAFGWFCHALLGGQGSLPITPACSGRLSLALYETMNGLTGFHESSLDEVAEQLTRKEISWGAYIIAMPELV